MAKKIILLAAFFLNMLMMGTVLSQSSSPFKYTVHGSVKDAGTGRGIAGIHVDLVGVTGEITDDNGNFTIKLPENDVILQFSGQGYAKREIALKGSDEIIIKLYEEGYKGAQSDVYTLVGAYQSSTFIPNSWNTTAENTDLSVLVSSGALLQGNIAGVNVTSRSGQPGSGENIFIHGFSSLHAGTTPLFVLDGLPVESGTYATSLIGNFFPNPLSTIDIKDIESITVMKDGTSVYGVKGANGVVLIKTKRAKELKTTINAHVHSGVNFEPAQMPLLNASEHKNLLVELIQRQNPGASYAEIMSLPYLDQRKPVLEAWGYEGNQDYYRYNHDTNWQDQIYQANFNQNYYLNISGGDEVANYMLALGFLDQKGTLLNTGFQRFNTRFNAAIRLTNKSYFNANMSYVLGTKNVMNEGEDYRKNPILASLIKAPFTSSHYYDEGGQMSPNVENYDIFGNSNPYVLANNNLLDNLSYRFVGSFLLGTKINNYLNINAFFGINFNKGRERVFYSTTGIYFDPINDTYIRNQSQHRVDRLLSLFGNAYINYERQFSFKHKVTAQAGVRYQNNNAEDDFGMGFNSLSDDFKSIGYGDALLRRVGGSIGAWDWLSLYAHADYAYKGRYLLNVALSSDQTSRSGEQAPAVFMYPQAAVAWIASSERFMQDVQGVSLLKFRFSSGLSGNDEIGNYTARRYYVSQNILGNYGMALGNFAETTLRPEKTFKLNGGIDLSALDERVNLSIDLYSNKITDMILLTTPDQRTGFDSYFANAGSMQNTGIDLSTNFRLINKQSFTWDLAIQASSYRNKILDLSGEKLETNVMGATIQTKVGQPLGIFYGYQTDGVFSTAAEANNEGLYEMHGLVKVPFGAGDVRFVNQTVGDKLIDENDRVKIGDPNPDLFGSISNTFKYKNFTLRAFFTYSLGNDVYNYTRSQLESLSTYNNQSLSTLMRWRKEGDVTTFPKAALGDPMGNARFSDRWIEDGSYLRMKSLSVSYDVPSKNIKAIGTLTVFATVENLLTISAYKGSDPEFSFGQSALYYGIDPGVLAQPRIFSLGFNLGL